MNFVRLLNLLAIGALVVAAVMVYRIKYDSTYQAEEVARLKRSIERERAAIAVLEAEWAHLTRPDRIEALAKRYLGMASPDPRQRVAIAAIPMRPARVDSIGDTIASLMTKDDPIATQVRDDPIARTIEAMGLALPTDRQKADRTMRALDIGRPGGVKP